MEPFIAEIIPFGGFTGGVRVGVGDVNNAPAPAPGWITVDSASEATLR